jgi:hypothetical protein
MKNGMRFRFFELSAVLFAMACSTVGLRAHDVDESDWHELFNGKD